jgi:hypothetical protein
MGLQSLQLKIKDTLEQDTYTQKDVLYTIAELYKYLERSKKGLGDSDDLKLDEKEYQTIKFFRNWMLHPRKDSNDIPEDIKSLLEKISDGDNNEIDQQLFELLKKEIDNFYKNIKGKDKIKWSSFSSSLKNILVEQPIKLSEECRVGYKDDSLILKKW